MSHNVSPGTCWTSSRTRVAMVSPCLSLSNWLFSLMPLGFGLRILKTFWCLNNVCYASTTYNQGCLTNSSSSLCLNHHPSRNGKLLTRKGICFALFFFADYNTHFFPFARKKADSFLLEAEMYDGFLHMSSTAVRRLCANSQGIWDLE